jgi:uncharacterized DUF497 family protein
MNYQWDPKKAKSNLNKHGISFADAVFIFEDENLTCIEEEIHRETRYIAIGMDAFARILVVVYTRRNNDIRIISARKATANEQRQYMERP